MNKIYIGNLSYSANEQDLESLFSEFGKNLWVKLIMDLETGCSKSFAFIELENAPNAQAALNIDGKAFQGRYLKVSLARDKRFRSSGDRGGTRW